MAIKLIITDLGIAEVINAEQSGTAPTKITQVGFGTGVYTPDPAQTELQDEFKRLSTIVGGAFGPNQIHVTVSDGPTPDDYSVHEIGLYLESGTLFAVYSQTSPIIFKTAESNAMLAVDIELTGDLDPDLITFGDANFQLNSATEEREGLIRKATVQEAIDGVVDDAAVTPEGLGAGISDALDAYESTVESIADDRIDEKRPFALYADAEEGVRDDVIITPDSFQDAAKGMINRGQLQVGHGLISFNTYEQNEMLELTEEMNGKTILVDHDFPSGLQAKIAFPRTPEGDPALPEGFRCWLLKTVPQDDFANQTQLIGFDVATGIPDMSEIPDPYTWAAMRSRGLLVAVYCAGGISFALGVEGFQSP